MPGIYIHIPYCKQACSYCDFYFSTIQRTRPTFVQALAQEIAMQAKYFGPTAWVDTVYLGGGTPSILTHAELATIFEALHAHFTIHPDAEITLEANPDDMYATALQAWQAVGVNRLSVGIQSFDNHDLIRLRRVHNAQMAIDAVLLAHEMGYANISIDLMFNLPQQDLAAWQHNVAQALRLPVQHLSTYGLTIEPHTLLAKQIDEGKVLQPGEEDFEAQYLWLMETLAAAGYEHYEVSNFCLPGYQSKHNSSYWQQQPYLGLGPSAHSYDGVSVRHWNYRNLHAYISAIETGASPIQETEQLTQEQQYIEYIMLGLRTEQGISVQRLSGYSDNAGRKWIDNKCHVLEQYVSSRHLVHQSGYYQATMRGRTIVDTIISSLLLS